MPNHHPQTFKKAPAPHGAMVHGAHSSAHPPCRYMRKPSKISFLFAELNSDDAVLSEFHNHSFVEGEIVGGTLRQGGDPVASEDDGC